MEVSAITDLIRNAKSGASFETWPSYKIKDIPFAVYDDQNVDYIDHPNPPESRPDDLVAATSAVINGVETATIPASMCVHEVAAVSLVYHEGFHVFQRHQFIEIPVDMFTAMAFYPDLDAEYRALCRLEEKALQRSDWSPDYKLSILGHLIFVRRSKLNAHPSLLNYERFLERSEGTAYYVEQRACKALFNIDPALEPAGHGWSRFYKVGAALCWLLEATMPGWTIRIEEGASPSDLIIEHGDSTIDLAVLDHHKVLTQEREALTHFKSQITSELEELDVVRIRYGEAGQQFRAFNPSTLVSLGDGRVLHRSFFKLLLPGRGSIAVTQMPVIDHVQNEEIILGTMPIQLDGGTLRVQTDTVEIELKGVEEIENRVFALKSE